ncbi:transport system permease protein [Methanosalsum zhilinae DSM 4017]|uniref:Cobalamin import system permease protein BtuC n=1 Tax=Methanosalsum zhilinae (strain DSM 4017 / NBRC 107636 / OCM 62 / WeN5) TaxID=679901 RepID=F7XKR8_METZD|nr:iron chelate uptake ABC transporter family permease subunit [Methanosalsum zhilinae]AEH61781.1 transport system permease protein [Methanosalsum zhilinae DSM 4017]
MLKSRKTAIPVLLLLLTVTITVSTAIGSTKISPFITAQIMLNSFLELLLLSKYTGIYVSIQGAWSTSQEIIVTQIRMPRVILAVLVGASLATAGCVMQALFKNPMADPYIIGMSSGAALGASVAFFFNMPVQVTSFIVTAVTIFVVYNIARVDGKVPTDTLLLAGIAVGFFLSAITSFIIYLSHSPQNIIYWMMGGFWNSTWNRVYITAALAIIGIVALYRHSWSLNVMLLGEEQAHHLGINIEYVKKEVLIFSALITAAAVSVSGIIGFVGLIIPHIMRIIVGPDHRILLPASTIAGAIFLVFSDTIARTAMNSVELPVGIITAMFGAPFFIYLLRKRRKKIYA